LGRLFYFYGDLRMKKSLLALAALSAIAGTAQAQSSVTLFGALDAGGYFANQVKPTAATGSAAWGVLANTIVSSNWGIKGSEDLGGGLKANFYAESGINPRNGALSQAGGEVGTTGNGAATAPTTVTLFDRGLYVGVESKYGSLDIGNKLNPFFLSHAGLVPVSGNSVATNAASAQGYFLPFVHNSISYKLPTMAGFNAAVQYGTGNQINDSNSGAAVAGSADYTIGGLNIRAAGQYLASKGTPVSANNIGAVGATANSPATATYLIGAKYNVGAFTLGGGWVANNINWVGTTGAAANPTRNINNFQLGVGYQATPAVLLGVSWIGNTVGSNLINAQARYAFSKRTQAYAQLGVAANGNGLGGAAGNGTGNMFAIAGSNGSQIGSGAAALVAPNYTQTAFGVGLIHTF
jgi:predicted porin